MDRGSVAFKLPLGELKRADTARILKSSAKTPRPRRSGEFDDDTPAARGTSKSTDDIVPLEAPDELCSVRVCVRVRPFIARERAGKLTPILSMKDQTVVLKEPHSEKKDTFFYDNCFWSVEDTPPVEGEEVTTRYASQSLVYRHVGTTLLANVLAGYNACLFAYGQTGSGKTHSMMGDLDDRDQRGIIPRLAEDLLARIATGTSAETSFRLEVAYMEIYNEKVKDLLSNKGAGKATECRVRQHPTNGPFVDGLTHLPVSEWGEIIEMITRGNAQRSTAATKMNDRSSRSHAVFTLLMSQKTLVPGGGTESFTFKSSKLNLVDLAGSERSSKTGITDGDRFEEMTKINLSLSTLSRVMDALIEAARKGDGAGRVTKPPYRESTLTWILADSLGGNSRTVMIATVSPAASNYGETLSTLRYAARARNIVNKVVVNEDPSSRLIRQLQGDVDILRQELQQALENNALLSSRRQADSEGEIGNLRDKLLLSERLMTEVRDEQAKEALAWEVQNKERELRLTHEQAARQKLQQDLEEMQDHLHRSQEEQNRRAGEVTDLHAQLQEKDKEIKRRSASGRALRLELESRLALKEEEIKHKSMGRRGVEQELEKLRVKLEAEEARAKQVEALHGELQMKENEMKRKSMAGRELRRQLEERIGEKEEELKHKSLGRRDVLQELESMRNEFQVLNTKNGQLEKELDMELQARMEQEKLVDAQSTAAAELAAQIEAKELELRRTRAHVQKAEAEREELLVMQETKLDDLKRANEEQALETTQWHKRASMMRQERDALQLRFKESEEIAAVTLEEARKGWQRELVALQEERETLVKRRESIAIRSETEIKATREQLNVLAAEREEWQKEREDLLHHQQTLVDTRSQGLALQQELDAKLLEVAALEEARSGLEQQCHKLAGERESLKRRNEETEQLLEKQLAIKDEEMKVLHNSRTTLEDKIASLQQQTSEQQMEMNREAVKRDAQLVATLAQLETLQNTFTTAAEEKATLETTLQEARLEMQAEIDQRDEQLKGMQQSQQELLTRQSIAAKKVKEAEDKYDEATWENVELREKVKDVEVMLEAKVNEHHDLETWYEDVERGRAEEARREVAAAELRLTTMVEEMDALTARLDELALEKDTLARKADESTDETTELHARLETILAEEAMLMQQYDLLVTEKQELEKHRDAEATLKQDLEAERRRLSVANAGKGDLQEEIRMQQTHWKQEAAVHEERVATMAGMLDTLEKNKWDLEVELDEEKRAVSQWLDLTNQANANLRDQTEKTEAAEMVVTSLADEYRRRLTDTIEASDDWRTIMSTLRHTAKGTHKKKSLFHFGRSSPSGSDEPFDDKGKDVAERALRQLVEAERDKEVLKQNLNSVTHVLRSFMVEHRRVLHEHRTTVGDLADFKGKFERSLRTLRRWHQDHDKERLQVCSREAEHVRQLLELSDAKAESDRRVHELEMALKEAQRTASS